MKKYISLLKLNVIIVLLLALLSCNISKKEYYENTLTTKIDKTAIYYEIFVRSYADSDNDGIGDINGITSKLDELKELGVQGIWLTPIFKSPSYHKYDVTDYYLIDPEYGTISDFKNLVSEAHKRNIKVIVDLPVNHTGKAHEWFYQDVEKIKTEKNYEPFYRIVKNVDKDINFKSTAMGHKSWNKIDDEYSYYAIFWDQMPDLNFSNQKVRDEIIKIAKYWIQETNIDGYRLDAAFHIYGKGEYPKEVNNYEENIKWWNEFRTSLMKIKEGVYIIGEVWQDTSQISKYFKVFDSNFNFAVSEKGIIKAISSKNGKQFGEMLEKIYEKYDEITSTYIDAPFLTNHDQNRIASILQDVEKQKLASSILLTLPGNPFIYYGEELGMQGRKPDESIREPYPWGDNTQTNWEEIYFNLDTKNIKEQKADKNSIYNHYKEWINIRKNSDELKYGDFKLLDIEDKEILAFERKYNNSKITVIHNLSSENKELIIDKKNIKIPALKSMIIK